MMKLVGLMVLLFSLPGLALVPVEGILLGEAPSDFQTDPLLKIFNEVYDKDRGEENAKLKLYYAAYKGGESLNANCSRYEAPRYASPWEEKQSRRVIASTLQYVGLDHTIKAIGAYARKLEVTSDQYKALTDNLVNNYCSKNVTVVSLRTIRRTLQYYYENPVAGIIPSVESSPYAPESMKVATERTQTRSREFDYVIKNFRAFCSWGGEAEDYRLLASYLSNRYIMHHIFLQLMGLKMAITKAQKVSFVPDPSTVQVSCTDLVCRVADAHTFQRTFPRSIGSTGVHTDFMKAYCHHFRFQDLPQKTNPQVKEWIKKMEIEDPIHETSQFLSLMTGVPDLFGSAQNYHDIPLLVRSSIDDRWNKWASNVLGSFSHDLFYEESFKVKVEPRRELVTLQTEGFQVDLTVTLGEMDRLMKDNDKLGLSFDLKLSKNYLRELKTKWSVLSNNVDTEGQKKFLEDVARYINIQLKEKEKLFTQKLWTDEFAKFIADELLQQSLTYRGPFFDSYQDEVLRIPVKFSYGLFAISYLRYRADVAAGRTKLNL